MKYILLLFLVSSPLWADDVIPTVAEPTAEKKPAGKKEEGDFVIEKRGDKTIRRRLLTISREPASTGCIISPPAPTFPISKTLRRRALSGFARISMPR